MNEIILTDTTVSSFVVPGDWNPFNNLIECIGAGGGASTSRSGPNGELIPSGGGGGGAYSAKRNVDLLPGSSVSMQVGPAGTNGGIGQQSGSGGDTWFSSESLVLAKGGVGGLDTQGGTGGQAAQGAGDVKFSGGNAGNGNGINIAPNTGGGGGGAAGPNGAGQNAQLGFGGLGIGGNGDNSFNVDGSVQDALGAAGLGGQTAGTAGGNGTEIDGSIGSGGGGAAGSASNGFHGGNGGLFGGGAGGAGGKVNPPGNAAQGVIRITYLPLNPGAMLIGL